VAVVATAAYGRGDPGGLRQPGLVNSAQIAPASAHIAVLSRGAAHDRHGPALAHRPADCSPLADDGLRRDLAFRPDSLSLTGGFTRA